MIRFVLVSIAALFSVGCSGRPSMAPTVNLQSGVQARTSDSSDQGEILLWVHKAEGGQARTYRLAAEGSLNILGQHEGIVLATSQGELAWQAKENEINLSGCDHADGAPPAPSKGLAMTAHLLNKAGQVVQKIVEPNLLAENDVDELQHHVNLIASIGPYLFIHESSYVYACGAHGNQMDAAMVWDAESGKTIDLWAQLPNKEKLATEAKRILDVEEDTVPTGDEQSADPEPAQFIPIYGDRGALRLDAQFARWACYACSDHEWSSYTRSAVVPTNWMPDKMRAWVTPPVVVKEFLEAHRDWRLGGWTKR
jgi:hypothetical protein